MGPGRDNDGGGGYSDAPIIDIVAPTTNGTAAPASSAWNGSAAASNHETKTWEPVEPSTGASPSQLSWAPTKDAPAKEQPATLPLPIAPTITSAATTAAPATTAASSGSSATGSWAQLFSKPKPAPPAPPKPTTAAAPAPSAQGARSPQRSPQQRPAVPPASAPSSSSSSGILPVAGVMAPVDSAADALAPLDSGKAIAPPTSKAPAPKAQQQAGAPSGR